MDYFVWTPAFDVSVPSMNDEHRTLISLMSRVNELALAGAPKPELQAALDELLSYTRRHFTDEEAYMRSIGYPSYEGHALIHRQLLRTLQAEIERFRAGPGHFDQAFRDFLKYWLVAHIRGIDTKYGQHAKDGKTAERANR